MLSAASREAQVPSRDAPDRKLRNIDTRTMPLPVSVPPTMRACDRIAAIFVIIAPRYENSAGLASGQSEIVVLDVP